ncbi:hypothetical protein BCR42DRAFT_400133 [Absidia repens]|uniref:GATA-type domain-containing protein n=1 Tax=Absidia repens TaxID=90262 RepID=A0A1X2J0X4_9FUNG|nr:hypothetical protein BCR42DRAFT_400133 [Absidia repens]
MADATCFWSLLSLQNLDFIHVSPTMGSRTVFSGSDTTIENLLLHHSLLDFIHPDERLLAKQDLSTFLQRKTLAGAVTRCRLRSFASIAKSGYPFQLDDDKVSTWDIVDMVMYIVTEGVVLAFFHNQDNCQKHSTCGESYFTPKDAGRLLTTLQAYQPLGSAFVTAPTSNSSSTNNDNSSDTVDRVLQLYDKCSKRRLLSWPPSDQYYNPEDGQHSTSSSPSSLLLQESSSSASSAQQTHQYHPSIYKSSCMQHIHSQSVIPYPVSPSSTNASSTIQADSTSPSHCQLERIVISYGCIIFYSFQINQHTSTRPFQHHRSTRDCDAQGAIDLPHLSDYRKLPEISLPSITSNNNNNINGSYSMSTNTSVPPIESQHYSHPHLQPPPQHRQHRQHRHHHHHQYYVSPPLYQHQKQVKRCVRCKTSDSPEWRRGPTGHKTLCNACGLRYSRLMSKKHSVNNKAVPRRYS